MASRELNILVAAKGAAAAARQIGAVDKRVAGLGKTAGRVGKGIALGVGAAATVGAAVIARNARSGIESLALLEDAQSQVQGALDSRNLAGVVSAQQISTWANEIESATEAAFDDKDITSATATLIRFGKIAPSSLRPAMEVMTDLAARTGSVDSASELLAKALADPAKAAGKLARSGVVLTKVEQDQIKAMVEAGKTADAQAFLLNRLAETTKGAAKASAGPYRDSLNILADVTEDAQRALGEGFMPVIMEVRDILTRELAKPQTIENIRNIGKGVAGGLRHLIDIARGLPWDSIGSALRIGGAGAKAILDAFTGLPPWVQTAVLTGWGLNKLSGGFLGSLASGLIKGVLGINAGVVNVRGAVVNGPGGVPAAGGRGLGLVGGALAAGGIGAAAATAVLDLSTMANAVSQGYKAAEAGDVRGIVDAQREMVQGLIAIPAPIKALGDAMLGFGQQQLDKLDDAESRQQETGERIRGGFNQQKAEMARNAARQQTAIERTKGAIDWNRMTTATKGDAIVAAVRALRFNVNVTVPITLNASQRRAVARAQTGGTMNRGPSQGTTPGQQEF